MGFLGCVMSKHVDHLLIAYVHRQLPRAQRNLVASHLKRCPECRAMYAREQELARDMTSFLPQIGQARRGQLARLWPAIWRDFSGPHARWPMWLSTYGLAVVMLMLCIFGVSALFVRTDSANAASLGIGPAAVSATFTPVAMIGSATAVDLPAPSETASAFSLPMASPIPIAAKVIPGDVRYVQGQ